MFYKTFKRVTFPYTLTTINHYIWLLDEIPEGYTDLSTPSAANPKKKNIKIQAPDGKKFSTIKAAQEYFAKSRQNAKSEQEKDDLEDNSENEEKDDSEREAKTVDSNVESDDDSGMNPFYVVDLLVTEWDTTIFFSWY